MKFSREENFKILSNAPLRQIGAILDLVAILDLRK